jgi:hypothetical protein
MMIDILILSYFSIYETWFGIFMFFFKKNRFKIDKKLGSTTKVLLNEKCRGLSLGENSNFIQQKYFLMRNAEVSHWVKTAI